MKRLCLAMALTIAFLFGCITAHVAPDLIAPPARAGTSPQKWEYFCMVPDYSGGFGRVTEKGVKELNDVGRQGWELVTAYSEKSSFCFKRPLP